VAIEARSQAATGVRGSSLELLWQAWAPRLLSILRIVTAFLFMQVGTAKLFAFPAAIMPGGGTAPVASLAGIAGILEAFGGALILVGLFTRPVAFLLSGEMAVAYFLAHAPQHFWPLLNGGAPAAPCSSTSPPREPGPGVSMDFASEAAAPRFRWPTLDACAPIALRVAVAQRPRWR
jgi:putative oxidoreductase